MCRPGADTPPYDPPEPSRRDPRDGPTCHHLIPRRVCRICDVLGEPPAPRRVLYTEPEDAPPPEWRDPEDVYRDREP